MGIRWSEDKNTCVWEGQPPVHYQSYNCNVKTKEPCKQLREKITEKLKSEDATYRFQTQSVAPV